MLFLATKTRKISKKESEPSDHVYKINSYPASDIWHHVTVGRTYGDNRRASYLLYWPEKEELDHKNDHKQISHPCKIRK